MIIYIFPSKKGEKKNTCFSSRHCPCLPLEMTRGGVRFIRGGGNGKAGRAESSLAAGPAGSRGTDRTVRKRDLTRARPRGWTGRGLLGELRAQWLLLAGTEGREEANGMERPQRPRLQGRRLRSPCSSKSFLSNDVFGPHSRSHSTDE